MRETGRRPPPQYQSALSSPLLRVKFPAGRTLCAAGQPIRNGQLSMPKVAAIDMCDHVRHFLGYHMIKEFEVLDFLEESGSSPPLFQQPQHDFSVQQNAENLNT